EAVARAVGGRKHRAEATLALRRAGADAVEVLLRMLVAAPGMSERRAVFDALTQMTEGMEQVVQMLDHDEWFVVRNVAELAGELGMEEAIPALSRQLDHADERVRKAVALGLAKIGSRNAAEPLRRALRDKSSEVRMQVALGIGGRKSSALAMPLVVAMDEETDDAVQRELMLALGRSGSPDAVEALRKFAQATGRIVGAKPSAARLGSARRPWPRRGACARGPRRVSAPPSRPRWSSPLGPCRWSCPPVPLSRRERGNYVRPPRRATLSPRPALSGLGGRRPAR